MDEDTKRLERRTFLCVLGVAGVTVGCGDAAMPTTPFSGGRVADHAVGMWKLYAAQKVIVGRDAGGFFAYSTLCTHEGTEIAFRDGAACATPTGCTSVSTTGNTRCPNHFSEYDGNGAVTRAPSTATLPHYRVTVAAGELMVHPDTAVTEAARANG